MKIKTDIEVQEQHFQEMKQSASKNRYNLAVYPAVLLLGLVFMILDQPELKTIPTEDPGWFMLIILYICGLAIYAWVRGTELNRVGATLTDDLNSICLFISKFSKYDLHLKLGYYGFFMFVLKFIKDNPEIIQMNVLVGILLTVLFSNQKIKDPMEWRKSDKIKLETDQ